jgi:hypothetical protein
MAAVLDAAAQAFAASLDTECGPASRCGAWLPATGTEPQPIPSAAASAAQRPSQDSDRRRTPRHCRQPAPRSKNRRRAFDSSARRRDEVPHRPAADPGRGRRSPERNFPRERPVFAAADAADRACAASGTGTLPRSSGRGLLRQTDSNVAATRGDRGVVPAHLCVALRIPLENRA